MGLFDKDRQETKLPARRHGVWRYLSPIVLYIVIENLVNSVVTFTFLSESGLLELVGKIGSDELYEKIAEVALDNYGRISFYTMAFSYLLLIPLLVRMHKKDERMAEWEDRKKDRSFCKRIPKPLFFMIILAGAVFCLGGSNMMEMSGLAASSEAYSEAVKALYSTDTRIELLVLGLVSPLAEEYLFRGLIYNRFCETNSWMRAAFWSSLMFALLHGNMVQGIYAFVFGLLACYLYERYGSLAAPILMHIGANVLAVICSETDLFDFTYQTDMAMYVSTFVCMIIMAAILYAIELYVRPYSEGEA